MHDSHETDQGSPGLKVGPWITLAFYVAFGLLFIWLVVQFLLNPPLD
jgi:hypothetical protein